MGPRLHRLLARPTPPMIHKHTRNPPTFDFAQPRHGERPDTHPRGRVCCRCQFTILSIYNSNEACYVCVGQIERQVTKALAKQRRRSVENEVKDRIRRLARQQVPA